MNKFSSLLGMCFCAQLILVGCANQPVPSEKESGALEESVAQVAKEEPTGIEADFYRGTALMQQKEWGKAEEVFLALEQTHHHLSGVYTNLAIIRWHTDGPLSAEEYIRLAVSKNERNSDAWLLTGMVAREKGLFGEAEAAYKQALSINPEKAEAHLNLAIVSDIYLAKFDQALMHYKRFAALQPEHKKAKHWIVDLERRMIAKQ